MLLALNAHHDLVEFTFPESAGGSHWRLVLDTSAPDTDTKSSLASGQSYGITGRSLLLFALRS